MKLTGFYLHYNVNKYFFINNKVVLLHRRVEQLVARRAQRKLFEIKPMDTKLKGDLAEQAVVFQSLKNGWEVLKPVGDRLPYDLVLDINGKLVKYKLNLHGLMRNHKIM